MRWSRRTRKALAVAATVSLAGYFIVSAYGWWWTPSFPNVVDRELAAPLMTYEEYARKEHGSPYIVDAKGLRLVGVRHFRSPSDPQRAAIETAWKEFKPTIALHEGNLHPYLAGLESAIGEFGESAIVVDLAKRDGVPLFSLEPEKADESASQQKLFSREQLLAFYTLRALEGSGAKGAEARERLSKVLSRQRRRLNLPSSTLPDVPAFEAFLKRSLPDLPEWTALPPVYLHPGVVHPEIQAEIGRPSTWLNEVATASNQFRDRHMVNLMTQLVRRGERVFAVVGSSHAVMQERSLKASLR